jgi:hypothetical protein
MILRRVLGATGASLAMLVAGACSNSERYNVQVDDPAFDSVIVQVNYDGSNAKSTVIELRQGNRLTTLVNAESDGTLLTEYGTGLSATKRDHAEEKRQGAKLLDSWTTRIQRGRVVELKNTEIVRVYNNPENPFHKAAIDAGLEQLVNLDALYKEMREKGIAQLKAEIRQKVREAYPS